MKARSIVFVAVLAALLLTLTVSVASAQSNTYLQINNGSSISVARGERPQIVLQFGARSAQVNNVAIQCALTGNLTLTGAAQANAFGSFSIAPNIPPFDVLFNKAITFPAVTALSNTNVLVDLRRGQNYNAAFNVNTSNGGGQVQCILVNPLFAGYNPLNPLATPGAILGAAVTTITTR